MEGKSGEQDGRKSASQAVLSGRPTAEHSHFDVPVVLENTLLFHIDPHGAEWDPEGRAETLSSPFSTSGVEREEKT